MSIFSYGALPPATHFSAYKFSNHPASVAVRPQAYDAYADLPQVLEDDDQGQFGACVGFATAQIVRYVLTKAGMTCPQLSPWMVWALARQQEGNLSQNAGTDPHDALTIVRNQGLCRLDLMPTCGPANNPSLLPSSAALADAATRKGIEFYQCNSVDELLTGMGTLGVPGDLCIAVYDDFETPNADETLPPVTGKILGYHDIQLRSYNDVTRTARIHNQWRGWTPDNEVTVTYDQLTAIWSQGYIVTHPSVPKPQPQRFQPQGAFAPAWKYLVNQQGDPQMLLDSGWGQLFRNHGCA